MSNNTYYQKIRQELSELCSNPDFYSANSGLCENIDYWASFLAASQLENGVKVEKPYDLFKIVLSSVVKSWKSVPVKAGDNTEWVLNIPYVIGGSITRDSNNKTVKALLKALGDVKITRGKYDFSNYDNSREGKLQIRVATKIFEKITNIKSLGSSLKEMLMTCQLGVDCSGFVTYILAETMELMQVEFETQVGTLGDSKKKNKNIVRNDSVELSNVGSEIIKSIDDIDVGDIMVSGYTSSNDKNNPFHIRIVTDVKREKSKVIEFSTHESSSSNNYGVLEKRYEKKDDDSFTVKAENTDDIKTRKLNNIKVVTNGKGNNPRKEDRDVEVSAFYEGDRYYYFRRPNFIVGLKKLQGLQSNASGVHSFNANSEFINPTVNFLEQSDHGFLTQMNQGYRDFIDDITMQRQITNGCWATCAALLYTMVTYNTDVPTPLNFNELDYCDRDLFRNQISDWINTLNLDQSLRTYFRDQYINGNGISYNNDRVKQFFSEGCGFTLDNYGFTTFNIEGLKALLLNYGMLIVNTCMDDTIFYDPNTNAPIPIENITNYNSYRQIGNTDIYESPAGSRVRIGASHYRIIYDVDLETGSEPLLCFIDSDYEKNGTDYFFYKQKFSTFVSYYNTLAKLTWDTNSLIIHSSKPLSELFPTKCR